MPDEPPQELSVLLGTPIAHAEAEGTFGDLLREVTHPRWRLVGDAAKNQATSNPTGTFFDVKRLIGRKFSDAITIATTNRTRIAVFGVPVNSASLSIRTQRLISRPAPELLVRPT